MTSKEILHGQELSTWEPNSELLCKYHKHWIRKTNDHCYELITYYIKCFLYVCATYPVKQTVCKTRFYIDFFLYTNMR